MGWTAIFDIVNKLLPDRIESLKNKKNELESKRDSLLSQKSLSSRDSAHLANILVELHKVEQKLFNAR